MFEKKVVCMLMENCSCGSGRDQPQLVEAAQLHQFFYSSIRQTSYFAQAASLRRHENILKNPTDVYPVSPPYSHRRLKKQGSQRSGRLGWMVALQHQCESNETDDDNEFADVTDMMSLLSREELMSESESKVYPIGEHEITSFKLCGSGCADLRGLHSLHALYKGKRSERIKLLSRNSPQTLHALFYSSSSSSTTLPPRSRSQRQLSAMNHNIFGLRVLWRRLTSVDASKKSC